MKIIYYSMHANNDPVFIDKLKSMGHEPVVIDSECADYTRDMKLAGELMEAINKNKAEAVVSFDYFPIISMVCDVCHIKYFAWVYDSPQKTLRARCVNLPCNRIAVFDSELVSRLKSEGIDTVHYQPLAADGEYFDRHGLSCTDDYSCDLSFAGSLYTGSYSYYEELRSLGTKNPSEGSGRLWQRLDELVERQTFDYDNDLIDEAVRDREIIDGLRPLMEERGLVLNEDYYDCPGEIISDNILFKQVTILERRRLLERVAEHCMENGYRFRLHTGSDTAGLRGLKRGVNTFGYIDYLTQLGSLFKKSRINLNITLRSIRRGIPLRCIDILACGGFLMTNPQRDFEGLLKEERDYVVYHSVEDCISKIDHYLKHEEERQKIAENGFKRAKELFNYEAGIERLLGF